MPHDWQFYEDFKQNEARLTIKRAIASLEKPCLIIHGDEDSTVSVNEAKLLKRWNQKVTLEVIENANHVFGASHPWTQKKLPKHFQQVISFTTSFLNN